jgi:hypothetical protein
MIPIKDMASGIRLLFNRPGALVLLLGGVCALAACGTILGIDDGVPKSDSGASGTDAGAVYDATAEDLGVDRSTGDREAGRDVAGDVSAEGGDATLMDASEADGDAAADGDATDGDAISPSDGADANCTPDPSWCNTHCGTGSDNCGQMRKCAPDCPTGEACTNNLCICQTQANWCANRCGMTTDNCGNATPCGNCEGGATCNSGVCGCTPQLDSVTCGARQCGQVMNNCGLWVECGAGGTSACPNAQFCKPDDTCCAPNNAQACANLCQVNATNNCGQVIGCPATCGGGQVCNQGQCCTPSNPCGNQCGVTLTDMCSVSYMCSCTSPATCTGGTCCTPNGTCNGNCKDNCGNYSSACCVDAGCMPNGTCSGNCTDNCGNPQPSCCVDSGGPPDGGCGSCTSAAQCPCSGYCGNGGSCVPYCAGAGTSCSTTSSCCYGLTCGLGPAAPAVPDGGMPMPDGSTSMVCR